MSDLADKFAALEIKLEIAQREAAEEKRKAAEAERKTAEAERKAAEAERKAAEEKREADLSKGGGMLLSKGLPSLGIHSASGHSSASKPGYGKHLVYDKPVFAQNSKFIIVDKYRLNDLNKTLPSQIWRRVAPGQSNLGAWSAETDIQSFVCEVLKDITCLAGLEDLIQASKETQLDVTEHLRPDIVIFRKHGVIIGVCEVKKPSTNGKGSSDLDSKQLRIQISNYMLRLMHTHGLKTVFGITTTYNHWRICWLQGACTMAAAANLTSVADTIVDGDKEILYESEVFERSNPALVEALVSVLLKMNASVIEPVGSILAQENVGSRRKFGLVDGDSFKWSSLPANTEKLSYTLPGTNTKLFYLLQDFHGGADGRVWLSCSQSGHLVVLKMSSSSSFTTELNIWQKVWNVQNARIVKLLTVNALVMPYAFHATICEGTVKFRPFGEWTAENPSDQFYHSDVKDVVIDEDSLAGYRRNPRGAAEQALRRLAIGGYMHTDVWWRHVALLPVCSKGVWTVTPIMLDCTNARELSPEETVERVVNESLKRLDEELNT